MPIFIRASSRRATKPCGHASTAGRAGMIYA
jgi:hypothetical protein